MDFLRIKMKTLPKDKTAVVPEFVVDRVDDLMVRGGEFYAVWHAERGLWSTDPYDLIQLVDRELFKYAERVKETTGLAPILHTLSDFSSGAWLRFKNYMSKKPDNYRQLDSSVTFANSPVTKDSYVSRRLSYSLAEGSTEAFDELVGILYDEQNLQKLMWAIGSIVCGESKHIQKFFVLFGKPGSGKSTILNLIATLFPGYYTTFDAKAVTGGSGTFSTAAFKNNPLIGLNHEGDLSRIRDNSILSSIVGHDEIEVNVKFVPQFTVRTNAILFIASNKPVSITDANSGIIRRLIDIRPTGNIIPVEHYHQLVKQLEFELGAIAFKCKTVFQSLGRNYYDGFRAVDMMIRTNHVFNFVDEHRFDFKREEWITLGRLWNLYKTYCDAVGITNEHRYNRNILRDELKNYWTEFKERTQIDGKYYRQVFFQFNESMFQSMISYTDQEIDASWLKLEDQQSIIDTVLSKQPAQYASEKGTPITYWSDVTTQLKDLDTTKLHYILPPERHIVIDFDMKDEHGNKSAELNIEAASRFPPTYAEVSKSGKGLHLWYIYDGDTRNLALLYSDGIEIKVPYGNASIRRQKTLCNKLPIVTISSGLPLRERKNDMVSEKIIKSERALRELVLRNLRKEIHPATKPSVDFIEKILADAYSSGLIYDLTDMLPRILEFASNSTNNAEHCIIATLRMKLASKEEAPVVESGSGDTLTFFDVEVFPNVTIIRYKTEGPDKNIQGFVNPSPEDISDLFKLNLVGFNNRRYDNHILYACYLGYTPFEVYLTSKAIIDNEPTALFREAYNISFTDVYDYSSIKQSLKKWEVALGLPHREFDWDWDTPLPEDMWQKATDYCDNDVLATESVHTHLKADYHARLIISQISGLTPNHSTLSHTAAIVFGKDREPQKEFIYPDLSKEFPGYTFEVVPIKINDGKGTRYSPKSTYRGEDIGEGGYVYAEPGFYTNVLYMDVASMHPQSIECLNLFGRYTSRYSELKAVRMAIKSGDLKAAASMFDGKLEPYLRDPDVVKQLEYSLKIVINIVYGLTAARFDNPFRDPRNKDNVVAKRGALFMVDLKHELQSSGIRVVHIKTDSVKIADHKPEDIEIVKAIGKRYGYWFGVECVFEKMLLINDAVLVGKRTTGEWETVGARFNHPYIFKSLFSKEPIALSDMAEVRSVQKGKMYIDMGPGEEDSDQLVHVGRVGRFYPVKESANGGRIVRIDNDKRYAVSGTKGYRWLLDEVVENADRRAMIDEVYFENMLQEAKDKISDFVDMYLLTD